MRRSIPLAVRHLALAGLVAGAAAAPATSPAQARPAGRRAATAAVQSPAKPAPVTPVAPLVDRKGSEMADVVLRFTADRGALLRRYDAEYSPARRQRLTAFYGAWRDRLREVTFDDLDQEGRVDYVLLDARLRAELALLSREDSAAAEMAATAPFIATIAGLQETRRRLDSLDARETARALSAMARRIDSLRAALERPARRDSGQRRDSAVRAADATAGAPNGATGANGHVAGPSAAPRDSTPRDTLRAKRIVALRSVQTIETLTRTLDQWFKYYSGYDPVFTWWVADPYKKADSSLKRYTKTLRERVVGQQAGQDEPIIGDPVGAAMLRAELATSFIGYTPEELLAIAEREFAWCEAEMRKAAAQMGYPTDWKAALEKVKEAYVEPGKQPELIRDLANEAIAFVESRNLVTVDPLAKEVWRMEMMTPEAQKVSPFFLGGEVIRVSYPTDGMTHEDKLMSMRGNNPHFSRATVHHELIPGHHLQQFMRQRFNPHRQAFETPFWTEGWALYWEMLLWDLGFPATPEDKIGMLFWRSHRAARIIFSLRVHLGTMTPDQAIDFLVDRVGHERANATAEVRRSFNGSYPPLYQLAYMIGGLQFRALREELVVKGKMTDREFHDAVLKGGIMPVDLVRARLTKQKLTRDYQATWRFAGSLPEGKAGTGGGR